LKFGGADFRLCGGGSCEVEIVESDQAAQLLAEVQNAVRAGERKDQADQGVNDSFIRGYVCGRGGER